MFFINNNKWLKFAVKGDKPEAKNSHTATLIHKSKMVIIGGYTSNYEVDNKIYILNMKNYSFNSP